MTELATAPKTKSSEPKRATAGSVGEKTLVSNAEPQVHSASCACGGGCPSCKDKKNSGRGILQAKLRVSAPDDAYEQEADRIADEILATPSGKAISSKTPPLIQRLTSPTAGYRTTAPPSVEHVLSGSGRSLDTELQQDMSQRFGQDFSQVRIHTGAVAEQSAQEINAHAYTVGRNIVFGTGQFAPSSQQGKRLLAHELTHVVQQSNSHEIQSDPSNQKQSQSGAFATFKNPVDRIASIVTGHQIIQRDGPTRAHDHPHRRHSRTVARHDSTAFDIFASSNPETASVLNDLDENFSLFSLRLEDLIDAYAEERTRGSVATERYEISLQAASRSSERMTNGATPFSPLTVYRWVASIRHALNAAGRIVRAFQEEVPEDQGLLELIPLRTSTANTALDALRQSIVQEGRAIDEGESEDDVESPPSPQETAISELLSLIRDYHRRWGSNLRENASLLIGPIVGIMDQHIGRDLTGLVVFFRQVRETSPELLNFLVRDVDLIDSVYRVSGSPFRVVAIAILGNWTEVLEEDSESVVAAGHGDELDEFSESDASSFSLAEDLIGTAADAGIGLIPGLDQLTDVRDLSADIVLIEQDIERQEFSIMHLVSLVFSLIGTFPELGTLISRGFRAITRAIQRSGYRGVARLANMLERLVPGIFDQLDEMSRLVGTMWQELVTHANRRWNSAMTSLTRITEAVFESSLERVNRIRHYVAEHMPAGMLRAREILGELVVSIRARASHVTDTILRTTTESLAAVRHRIQGLTATGRLRRELANQLEELEIDVIAAVLAGNDRLATQLLTRLSSLADEAERAGARVSEDVAEVDHPLDAATTLTSSAERRTDSTLDTTETPIQSLETTTESTRISSRVSSEVFSEEQRTLQFIAEHPDAITPIEDASLIARGYQAEVDVGNSVTYRRRMDGVWCRFNSPADCNVTVPAELEAATINLHLSIDPEIDPVIETTIPLSGATATATSTEARAPDEFGFTDEEFDSAFDEVTRPPITGGPQSGYRIGGRRVPYQVHSDSELIADMTPDEIMATPWWEHMDADISAPPRRRLDAHDVRFEDESYQATLLGIRQLIGERISDTPLIASWTAVRARVLNGRAIDEISRDEMLGVGVYEGRGLYQRAQRYFWDYVRADAESVTWLDDIGFELRASGAAHISLNDTGRAADDAGRALGDIDTRVTLDHILEKARGDNWRLALNGDNLRFEFHLPNSEREISQMRHPDLRE